MLDTKFTEQKLRFVPLSELKVIDGWEVVNAEVTSKMYQPRDMNYFGIEDSKTDDYAHGIILTLRRG